MSVKIPTRENAIFKMYNLLFDVFKASNTLEPNGENKQKSSIVCGKMSKASSHLMV